jgi:predicted nucleic-acid-binding Zn-ribbon protein
MSNIDIKDIYYIDNNCKICRKSMIAWGCQHSQKPEKISFLKEKLIILNNVFLDLKYNKLNVDIENILGLYVHKTCKTCRYNIYYKINTDLSNTSSIILDEYNRYLEFDLPKLMSCSIFDNKLIIYKYDIKSNKNKQILSMEDCPILYSPEMSFADIKRYIKGALIFS